MRRSTTHRPKSMAAPSTQVRPLGEVFWLAYRKLSEEDRDAFLSKLLDDDNLRGALLDTILLAERRDGPYHPEYETYLKELEQERADQKVKRRR